ncbi:hypothetical protein M153_340001664 [Pseudoloma neurophilia]|uniref:Uncharacterized protein n=1 Tax=Pseudoloma neurophilia TaxID=146866 RepID=A0A0R0M644_9MICR|nr:hypothetical protein M153_340001664 [Pseudoloma neurophilia]
MVLMVFLLLILVLRAQNGEIQTEDFMNFSNPIDQREIRQFQNLDLFIEQYLNFNADILQESDNHANIQVQRQNNMASDLFCEIPCDSSFMNIENIPSTSLYHLKSDQELLYDEIESFLDSTSFEIHNPTIGTSVSSFEPECECVGLCLCITNTKLDKKRLDSDFTCHINSDIFLSEILFSNKQNQQDEIKNMDFLQYNPCHIECEIVADFNSTEQCLEREIYPDKKEKFSSSVQIDNIILPSHISYNPKLPEHIEKIYIDNENKLTEGSRAKTNFEEESEDIQRIVEPLTSQEIVISGVKNAKKRKCTDESNKIAKRKTENIASIVEESFPRFHSGESQTCLNISENELLVDRTKTIYDPDSQDDEEELDFHLKNCNYNAHSLPKKIIIEIIYQNSEVKSVNYIRMGSDENIPKTEKSNNKLHIYGTYKYRPSSGGTEFTVRVPKLFEDGAQFEISKNLLPSAFVPMTNADTYNLTLKMSRIHLEHKLPSASFKLDNETEYVPSCFYAYHLKQVLRFKLIRRMQGGVFYYFEYRPEKKINA